MDKENPFKIKSENNLECVSVLENRKFFGAAVNRLYYSLYQKALFLQDVLGIPIPEEEKEEKNKESHNEFFERLISFLIFEKLINGAEMKDLIHMNTLKSYRVQADYKKTIIVKKDVELARTSYEICSNIIDKITKDDAN